MEEVRCVLEGAQEEADVKLKIIERPVAEEDGHEEENGGGGDAGEDSDDDVGAWDENGDPCLPFIGYWDPPVLVCAAAATDHPYFKPCGMMQVFSLRLSNPIDHPVSIYGTFSIRDGWEPLCNYLFKRSRDDPAMIPEGCSFLPLRSPCRGIYVDHYFLIDVDLWIKGEGGGSADKLLFHGYVELDTVLEGFGSKLLGRFLGDCHGLDMHYAFLPKGIETVIEVLAEAEHPSDLKFSASTSDFDHEISLYDGTFCGSGAVFKHCMAVNKQEELHIILKMDGSQYKWTFKAGVGVVTAPEHPVPGFSRYFVMNVSFRTKGKAASGWQWSCICNVLSMKATL
ncbi:unnamed protein product [Urochloa humidicola]